MADAAPLRSTLRPVDAAALRRVRRRLAALPHPPWLHGEVARRMGERLPVIVKQPQAVIDWWSAAGASTEVLRRTYPQARRIEVEVDPLDACRPPAPWWSMRRWRSLPGDRRLACELAPGQGQLLWANMMLHWVDDPQAEMQRWFEVLEVDGFLMFSTLGPGSLTSLRDLYAAQGWPAPHAPFVDMHDLGDMLVHAGFADPVMDQETLTLTWADAGAMLAELHALGGNADRARCAGLRTPRWRDRLLRQLQPADGSRPALSFELVYGHAFRPRPRVPVAPESVVGLSDMRSILRGRRVG